MPYTHAYRSAMEALGITLMYLIPVYATLEFSAARRGSFEVTWSGLLLRYTFAALLTFLFVHLKTDSVEVCPNPKPMRKET